MGGVHVLGGRDGDGLNGAPTGGGEAQGGGAACQFGGEGRRHRDIAAGDGVQHDGVEGVGAFIHGERRGGNGDAGCVTGRNGHDDGLAAFHARRGRPAHVAQIQGEGLRRLRHAVVGNRHGATHGAAPDEQEIDPFIADRRVVGPGYGRSIPGGDNQLEFGPLDGDRRSRGDDLEGVCQGANPLHGLVGIGGELHPDGIVIPNGHHGGVDANRHGEVGIVRIRRQREGEGLCILGNGILGDDKAGGAG